ncbi:MAG: VacJ family lipoprotein [Xylophilus ampelinus]
MTTTAPSPATAARPPSAARAGFRASARLGATALALAASVGCASGPGADPRDPFEPFNRGVSRFNDTVDDAVLRPVARAYVEVTPNPVRTGVSNFFRNLTEPWSAVNNLAQLKVKDAAESWIRFNVNFFFGLGGLLDVAGEMDIDRHPQDFGQTLASYGVPTGPYLVLPVLGPSTVRDAATIPIETRASLIRQGVDEIPVRNSLYALRIVDARANLLRVSSVLEQAALDKYTFTRDAYLQLRRNQPRGRDTTDDTGNYDDGAYGGSPSANPPAAGPAALAPR